MRAPTAGAICAWILVLSMVAEAQERQPIIVAGLRPTSDRGYRTIDFRRLPEAQRLREIVGEVIRDITQRPILNHAALRVELEPSYLVSFFDCDRNVKCVVRVFASMSDRSSLIVFGDYATRRDRFQFRIRLLDLRESKLLAEVEFSLDAADLSDLDSWRRELEVLLAQVEIPEASGGDSGGGKSGAASESSEAGQSGEGDEDTAMGPGETELDDLDALEGKVTKRKTEGKDEAMVTRLRGNLAAEFRSYPLDRRGPKNDEQAFVESDLELSLRVGEGVSFLFRPRFLIDTLDTELKRFEPYEGYVEYAGDSWDVRGGQFIDSWGIADAYNPLDVLNRRDIAVDMLDPPALGELGLRARYHFESESWFGEPSFAVYAMPLWRETPLPTDDYRYSFSQEPFVLVHDPEYPEEVVDGGLGAVRFEHTITGDAFSADLQYIGARGPARAPTLTAIPQGDGTIQLLAEYYGAWVAGGGFRLVPAADWWSKLTFKAEVAYTRPYLYQPVMAALPEDYIQYVAGFDRVFSGLFKGNDAITLTIEYLGESLADDLDSDFRPFQNDAAVRLAWEAEDFARTSIELRGVVDVKNGELFGEATFGRQLRFIHDDLRLDLAGQGVRPRRSEEGFFSFFPNNSNLRVRMAFNF